MKSTITELEKKISQIREYLRSWEKFQYDIFSFSEERRGQLPKSLQSMLRNPNKKIFDYKLAILILYGSFENYVESIISQYILKLNATVDSFLKLPKQIQSRHTELSAKLMGLVCAGYNKYEQINNADVVKRLYSCYTTPQDYKLNIAAFTQHSSNLRINIIRELFAGIGILSIDKSISKNPEFIEYLKKINPEFCIMLESKNDTVYRENCFQLLNDLVERRNDIAHGVDDADDNILSTDVLLEYADYIVALANAIYSVVFEEYAKIAVFSQGKNTFCLGNPIQIFDNRIVCFNNKYCEISVGDTIVGVNIHEKVLHGIGHIESLQVNRESMNYISSEASVDFGARISFHANGQYTYYIIK